MLTPEQLKLIGFDPPGEFGHFWVDPTKTVFVRFVADGKPLVAVDGENAMDRVDMPGVKTLAELLVLLAMLGHPWRP